MPIWGPHTYNGIVYTDPRDEMRARAHRAEQVSEEYVAIPVDLIQAALALRECQARTIINGDPSKRMLIEVKCQRMVDPVTNKHDGMHVNGRINWQGPTPSMDDVKSDPLAEKNAQLEEALEQAHDLAAVSHLIPDGEWTEPLVKFVMALHDLNEKERSND